MDRNVHDGLLELLPGSTIETMQVKKLTSLNPRLRTADRLYDKNNWVQDVRTALIDLNLFKKWFAKRILYSPHANTQNVNLGKLVVPSVFMDYDLLEAIEKSYDHATRVVRRLDGEVPVSISSVKIYATM